ncbi:PPC domain-containing DNA-binding protein [Streptosporangium sp. NPDC023825]|uniref:PPC domain-containing DNA-binding protein n=1 Tax=Streptosporangium sp. NPDC023825 TaxID=3154909 RepID=UPI003415025C
MQLISVQPGEELLTSIARQLQLLEITSGAIVSLIGAVDSCGVVNMPAYDAMKEVRTEFEFPVQLTGTGEIVGGKPHIHCVLTGEDHKGIGGHLLWAKVESWFVNVYIIAND